MRKCHLINAPWLFNTAWWVIKGWLATKTIEKIGVLGSCYLAELEADISMDNLPAALGGNHTKPTAPFPFAAQQAGEGVVVVTPSAETEKSEVDEEDRAGVL